MCAHVFPRASYLPQVPETTCPRKAHESTYIETCSWKVPFTPKVSQQGRLAIRHSFLVRCCMGGRTRKVGRSFCDRRPGGSSGNRFSVDCGLSKPWHFRLICWNFWAAWPQTTPISAAAHRFRMWQQWNQALLMFGRYGGLTLGHGFNLLCRSKLQQVLPYRGHKSLSHIADLNENLAASCKRFRVFLPGAELPVFSRAVQQEPQRRFQADCWQVDSDDHAVNFPLRLGDLWSVPSVRAAPVRSQIQ